MYIEILEGKDAKSFPSKLTYAIKYIWHRVKLGIMRVKLNHSFKHRKLTYAEIKLYGAKTIEEFINRLVYFVETNITVNDSITEFATTIQELDDMDYTISPKNCNFVIEMLLGLYQPKVRLDYIFPSIIFQDSLTDPTQSACSININESLVVVLQNCKRLYPDDMVSSEGVWCITSYTYTLNSTKRQAETTRRQN